MWLDPDELRIGLGCMRLPADEELALETVATAADAGMTVFDTAHAYAPVGAPLGHNERMVAHALRSTGGASSARILTKGGMTRPGGKWVPDGRQKALVGDCEASLAALGGMSIDLYLIHAPDPRTPWRTSLRALARLSDERLVRHVGLANVTRAQLDEAIELAPVAAVQVAINPFDDRALRGGVLARCVELGITVIAHSPLGGPDRAGRLARNDEVARIAARHDATAAEAALAWLLGLAPGLVAIPGARRPATARSAARVASVDLGDDDHAALSTAFGGARARSVRSRAAAAPASVPGAAGEIVVVLGIPGAGKSLVAARYVDRGYLRLNRDERGGSLRALAAELERRLASGIRRVVLDNTYLTRASRSYVVDAGVSHGVPLSCVWLDTPLAQAQVNLVERLLDRFGSLPTPEALRQAVRSEPWLMLPTSQMRALRELEPPSVDEGFAAVERVAFTRAPIAGGRAGAFVAAAALNRSGLNQALASAHPGAPHLLFDWIPEANMDAVDSAALRLADAVKGPVDAAVCPHPGGPPTCWCRPPLPGLLLAFARTHDLDPAHSVLIGCSRTHATLGTTLGARYVEVAA